MLSHTAEYALRAVLHIAANSNGSLVRVGDIADALDVPQNYLSKVLNTLARLGILTSTRGPRGGFQLTRPPEDLTLADVIEPFDPMKDRAKCLLIQKECSDDNPCIAHHEWKKVAIQVRAFFRQTTLAELLKSGAPGFGLGLPERPAAVD